MKKTILFLFICTLCFSRAYTKPMCNASLTASFSEKETEVKSLDIGIGYEIMAGWNIKGHCIGFEVGKIWDKVEKNKSKYVPQPDSSVLKIGVGYEYRFNKFIPGASFDLAALRIDKETYEWGIGLNAYLDYVFAQLEEGIKYAAEIRGRFVKTGNTTLKGITLGIKMII